MAPEVSPPGFVTLVHRVQHASNEPVTVAVDVDVPSAWSILTAPEPVAVDPYTSELVLVTVRVPADAPAGALPIRTTVRDIADSGETAQISRDVFVKPVTTVRLTPMPPLAEVPPGGIARFDLVIANAGNRPAEILIAAASAWPATVEPEAALIPVGGEMTASITHRAPPNALPGERVGVIVSVTLADGTDERAQLTSFVTPDPNAVWVPAPVELEGSAGLTVAADPGASNTHSVARIALSGAGFALRGVARSLFGPGPLALETIYASYEAAGATGAVGDVTVEISDLLLTSGRGGLVAWDGRVFHALLMAGWAEAQARAAARMGLQLPRFRVDLGYAEWRATARQAAWSLALGVDPFDAWSLTGEVVGPVIGSPTGWGWLAETSLLLGPYTLDAEALWAGPDIPSSRAGRRGLSLQQRLDLTRVVFHIDASRWITVSGTGVSVERMDRVRAGLRTLESPDGLALSASGDWQRSADLVGPRDPTITKSIDAALSGFARHFPSSFSARISDTNGPSAHTTGIQLQERTGLLGEGWRLHLSAAQAWVFDWSLPYWARERDELRLEVSFDDPDIGLGFGYVGLPAQRELAVDAWGTIVPSVRFRLGARLQWSRVVELDAALGWSVSVDADLRGLSLPLANESATLTGEVFLDSNANGRRDEEEEGLADLLLDVDSVLAVTDAQGRFRLPPLPAGEVQLRIPRLPMELVPDVPLPLAVTLQPFRTTTVNVPVHRAASLQGKLVLLPPDDAKDAVALPPPDAGGVGGGIPGVTVRLSGATQELSRTTETDGSFRFERLRPGRYLVEVLTDSLPALHSLADPQREIELDGGESAELRFEAEAVERTVERLEGGELELQRPPP
jgi:hypothetical protein